MTLDEKLEWIISDDVGISSKVIWAVMMGLHPMDKCTPSDPSDFGRCYRLLKKFPEWEERVHELGDLLDYSPIVNGEQRPNLWQVFADNYEAMCRLYELDKDCGGKSLYLFMKKLGF